MVPNVGEFQIINFTCTFFNSFSSTELFEDGCFDHSFDGQSKLQGKIGQGFPDFHHERGANNFEQPIRAIQVPVAFVLKCNLCIVKGFHVTKIISFSSLVAIS